MRRRVLLAALVAGLIGSAGPFIARVLAAGPVFGNAFANTGGNDFTIPMTGVSNLATVAVGVGESDSQNRTLNGVSDNVNGAYSLAVGPIKTTGTNLNRQCWIYYKQNVSTTGGALTVSVDVSAAAAVFGTAVWFTGAATGAPTTSSAADSADTLNHTAASSLSVAADFFTFSFGAANAAMTTWSPTASPAFVSLSATSGMSTSSMAQYYRAGLAISANNLAWTSTGTSRSAASCTAAFAAAAASGGGNSQSLLGLIGL